MEEEQDDILLRLESVIDSWTTEVDEAQRRLAEQLAETRGRLQNHAETATESLQFDIDSNFAILQRLLEDCREAVRDAFSRLDVLEAEVQQLRDEVAELRESRAAEPAPELKSEPESPKPMAWRRTRKVTIKPFDETGAPRRMGQILVDAGLITAEQLETALALQQESPERKLGSILVEQGYTGEDVIPQVLARQLRLRYIRLREGAFDPRAVTLISGSFAEKHACIPVRATKDTLALAMANPLDIIAIEDVEKASGRRVQPIIARESEVLAAIAQWYEADEENGADS